MEVVKDSRAKMTSAALYELFILTRFQSKMATLNLKH